ncbi:MAG: hypothetical protein ACYDBB_06375 [Armatimonadota bacterium]
MGWKSLWAKGMRPPSIEVEGATVILHLGRIAAELPLEYNTVIRFASDTPDIAVYEDDTLCIQYHIDPLLINPSLAGQFLHTSIRVLANYGLMIDGIITKTADVLRPWNHDQRTGARRFDFDEAIRFHPVFLSPAAHSNAENVGKGLFSRGLHFPGHVTPTSVRACCVCDACRQSFSLHHIHLGFSNAQAFYCENGIHTLLVGYDQMPEIMQLNRADLAQAEIQVIDAKLPLCTECGSSFRCFNPLRCPHCHEPYIDFLKYPALRQSEYYGYYFINQTPQHF